MFGLPQIGKQRVESVQILKAILGEKSLNGKQPSNFNMEALSRRA